MGRRWVAICTTATLSIFALLNPAVARTSNKSTPERRSAATASRSTTGARSGGSRTLAAPGTHSCTPCAAELAKSKKGASHKKGSKTAKNSPCHPNNYLDPKIALSYNAALRDMKRAGIKPEITSAWRSSQDQAQLRRCSMSTRCRRANPGLYLALPAGKSMHEAGFAVDMSGIAAGPRGGKRLTSKGRRIVSIMRKNGFNWRYGLSDPAHFEADPRKHGYRTVAQAINRTQTTCQLGLARSKARKVSSNKATASRSRSLAKSRSQVEATAAKTRHPMRRDGP
jgi:LAS superfamily LD-carboxypeptidase LdcB